MKIFSGRFIIVVIFHAGMMYDFTTIFIAMNMKIRRTEAVYENSSLQL